jgi:cobalt-zinc-cadmium efflux system membrane fusion protein
MNEPLSTINVLEPPLPARQGVSRNGRGVSFFAWLGRGIPTLLVLTALGGLGYWGHHTGWKLPKFSTLNGGAPAEEDDWCREHSVPESRCVECRPGLLPRGKDYGWCQQHGVHQCPWCHPEVAQVEDKPKVSPDSLERAQRALELRERPENSRQCLLYRRRIQFASEEAVARAGVDVDLARERPMAELLVANAETAYDQTRLARLSTRVPGTVWRVEKRVGDGVKEGEALALVDAAEVGRVKGEFLQALAQVRLRGQILEDMRRRGSSLSGRTFQEAETALSEARIRLLSARQSLVNLGLPVAAEDWKELSEDQLAAHVQFLGLPRAVAGRLDPRTTTANLIPLKAPFEGLVVARQAVAGEVVDPEKTLFVVADTRRLWLTLHVRQEDARYLALGQPVRFRADGSAGEAAGEVTWISTAVDEKTRTVEVRADLPNPQGRLRAGAFGTGRIVLREEKGTVVVPSEAVHWDGSCHVVFVRDKDYLKKDAPKVFHTRTVRPGAKDEKYTEILAGVLPGEVVASKGSGVLRAELLKNNLGAG